MPLRQVHYRLVGRAILAGLAFAAPAVILWHVLTF
jgi:hypothetical protein